MIGIKEIGVYIPNERVDNLKKIYGGKQVDESFVRDKVGFIALARQSYGGGEENSANVVQFCIEALKNLQSRLTDFDVNSVDFICVCTQNGQYQIPHTSALLHGELNLPPQCATFDLSLGCSGYVYALDIVRHFMEGNNFHNGLIFTCDLYSKIISPQDKNTDLIFGDAATVTLMTDGGIFTLGKPQYLTKGSDALALVKKSDAPLFMDGRKIFNFVLKDGAATVIKCLEKNTVSPNDIDLYLFHQASLYVVENLARQLKIPLEKVPFDAREYGNTLSSSIPILLQNVLNNFGVRKILMCGFGVGLSVAAITIVRISD